MTMLLSIPVAVAWVMGNLLFGTDELEQKLLQAKAHAQYLALMG
jgi:hypothetical protein